MMTWAGWLRACAAAPGACLISVTLVRYDPNRRSITACWRMRRGPSPIRGRVKPPTGRSWSPAANMSTTPDRFRGCHSASPAGTLVRAGRPPPVVASFPNRLAVPPPRPSGSVEVRVVRPRVADMLEPRSAASPVPAEPGRQSLCLQPGEWGPGPPQGGGLAGLDPRGHPTDVPKGAVVRFTTPKVNGGIGGPCLPRAPPPIATSRAGEAFARELSRPAPGRLVTPGFRPLTARRPGPGRRPAGPRRGRPGPGPGADARLRVPEWPGDRRRTRAGFGFRLTSRLSLPIPLAPRPTSVYGRGRLSGGLARPLLGRPDSSRSPGRAMPSTGRGPSRESDPCLSALSGSAVSCLRSGRPGGPFS